MPISAMRFLHKQKDKFSLKLCKYYTNGLVCLNLLRDKFCVYTHDEFCKEMIDVAKTRKLDDNTIILYLKS